jgi:hypothetical protein
MNQRGNNKLKSIGAGGRLHRPNSPEAVLRDLASLIEEFGPAWYTEAHHRRVQAVLGPDAARRSASVHGPIH